MKKINSILLLLFLMLTLSFVGCEKDEEKSEANVESITFSELTNDTLFLTKGDKGQLKITTVPANSPVKFYATTPEAFRVNQNTGEVTAIGGGIGTVTAIAPNGDSWTKTQCHVFVTEYVEGIQIGASNLMQILASGTRNVSTYFTVLPYSATTRTITYSSSHPEFATVNATTGVVTVVSKGLTEITATATDGSQIASEPIQFYSGYTTTAVPRTTPSWTATASSTEAGNSYTPARGIDGNTTSTSQFWHASWSNPTPHPHYYQVDMGIARTFNEVEIYRRPNYADTRDVEIYIIPAGVTTSAGLTWTDPRYELWGSVTFGDEPSSVRSKIYRTFPQSTVSSRYLMLKFLNSNRNAAAGDQSLSEVVPRIIQ